MKPTTMISVFLVLLIFMLSFYLYVQNQRIDTTLDEPYFSEYANDWVEAVDDDDYEINVTESSGGTSDYSLGHQRMVDVDGKVHSFDLVGSYNGEAFYMTYLGPKEQKLMRIRPEMNPYDGVPEGFALVKRENDQLVVYIFVDDDWKRRAKSNINIIYGDNIDEKENLLARKFSFSSDEEGIYIDKVEGGLNWLIDQNPVEGRLFFGEITLEDIKSSNYKKTFIMLV